MSRGMILRVVAAMIATAVIAWGVRTILAGANGPITLDLGALRPIDLLTPGWLYLATLVPAIFFIRTQSLTDVSVAQQYLQAGFRSLVLLTVAFALCRPVWVASTDRVATCVLVDVSDSISDAQLDAARAYVDAIAESKPDDDSLCVITFAERPHLVARDAGEAIARHPEATGGTDIQAAIQLAYGVFPAGHIPRIIVVSDGNETHGKLAAEAFRAAELNVPISWKTFPHGRIEEVRVIGLHIPDEIKVGAPFEVTATVWASHEDEVTFVLYQDDFPNALEPRETVKLEPGENEIVFKSEAKRAGFTSYRLEMRGADRDTEVKNNTTVMSVPVKGRPRVLYVEGGVLRNAGSARYLERALEHENIDVEVRGPRGIPSTAKELRRYDLLLISDVRSHFVGLAEMRAIESYVRDFGGGFIMAGGEDSFGSGGYQGTRIEKILPVRLDGETVREKPNIAVVLVIDRSGSMSGAKIEAAKDSARATVEALEPSDLIGVVAFDSQPTAVVRLQRAQYRLRISTDIARLSPGGGTNIYPALEEAYQILQMANAKVKHVILLSDGQAPYAGIADLCEDMRAAGITVSAVGIGDADRTLLTLITDAGDGRLYMTRDLGALPRIFMEETTEAKRSSLIEDLVTAQVAKRVDMIEGINIAEAPPLRGYVSTKAKDTSEVVLISNRGEPLLARWRVGTGQTVAWTSDVKNRWAVDWIRWQGFPKFWAQVVRSTMRHKVASSYDLSASVEGGRAHVIVDAIDVADEFVNGLETTLEITDPLGREKTQTIPMQQTAAGRYEAELEVEHYGAFVLKAVHRRDGDVVAESMGAVALPYPREYLTHGVSTESLRQAAAATGGHDAIAPADAFADHGESIEHTEDLWPWVLLVAAALLVLDVYLKRVRIFGYRTMEA